MSKIIGNPVGTTLPKPDWTQTDPSKGDYIKNKPDFDGLESRVGSVSELVGDTPVATQISTAIAAIPETPTIIDVSELPADNINESALYRLFKPMWVSGGGFVINSFKIHVVETLPEIGEMAYDGTNAVTYYNLSDDLVYGYINDILSGQFGVPAGWYQVDPFIPAIDSDLTYGGVVDSIEETTDLNKTYVVRNYELYSYKNEWNSLKSIGKAGTGINAEIFNNSSNIASGHSSHAEGDNTTASGGDSHSEGYNTTASGGSSHAEGSSTEASGVSSHAEGSGAIASGRYSHAEGEGTVAASKVQHVQGKYNIEDADDVYAHIVGNGTGKGMGISNAHTLDWSGNAWFAGDVYVGSTSGTNKDEGSKKLITSDDLDEFCSAFITIGSPDTLTWDGNTDGLYSVNVDGFQGYENVSLYKISDVIPSYDDLAQGYSVTMNILYEGELNEWTVTEAEAAITPVAENAYIIGEFWLVVIGAPGTYYGLTFEQAGIYSLFMDGDEKVRVASFTINGYTGFPSEIIKPEALPMSVADKTYVDAKIAAFADSVPETLDTLAEKTYVDNQDTATLNSAKSYTDAKLTELIGDTAVADQINTAISGKADKTYVDSEVAKVSILVGDTAIATQIATALDDYATKNYVDELMKVSVHKEV